MKFANGTYRLGTIPPESYMKMARMIAVSPTLLEVEMAKPINAHASIWGWVALDSLRHVGLTPGQIYFRIKLRDSSNKEDSPYVVELPRKQPDNNAMDINCGTMLVTNVTADISGSHLKYWPPPKPSVLSTCRWRALRPNGDLTYRATQRTVDALDG